jgi:hypothetical protein
MLKRPPTAYTAVFVYLLFMLILISQTAFTQTYELYFGNLHSHTWYSDGNQDQDTSTYKQPVAKAFQYGRTVANNLNWLAVTDHNHSLSLNMTMNRWRAGNAEADTANKDGIFVGFYGQEWGTLATGKGHALVLGTNKLFGWQTGLYDVYVPQNDYSTANTSLWRKVLDNGGFIYLAHPSSNDFDNVAANSYNSMIDSVLRGVAVKSGKATSTNVTQTDPSTSNYESYYHNLLAKGYHVAPTSDQDNHNTNFGMSNQQRTVVLAPSLTRENILNAIRNRKTYASEDNNLKVRFDVGSHSTGDIFSEATPFAIKVKVSDASAGESFSRIEIRSGVPGSGTAPVAVATATNVDSLVYTVNQTVGSTKYYYAYVLEADGHRAWTAPMWITATNPALAVVFGTFTAVMNINGKGVKIDWTTLSEINSYGFHVQRKMEGESEFMTITTNPIPGAGSTLETQFYSFDDTTVSVNGNYTYRILQLDSNGLEQYSNPVSINYNFTGVSEYGNLLKEYRLFQSYPNPFNPSTTISFQIPREEFVSIKVFDVLGKEIGTLLHENMKPGKYNVNWNAENYPSGIYYCRMQTVDFNQSSKLILVK